ncbi:hypothetical protein HP550_06595 [Cellulomonas humilata]|uniref:Uncharacterized protein n=1 Tax=Cellulomonas humilata TaxID=144055 RepID=A0A7Y5ZZF6_9CELL|nr:hypothetical protein [Cellulomonas humilata]NUU16917.1 hypothetical protein [Cellulomonas humilata]
MKAHVTYADDGTILSIGLGGGLLADDESTSGEFELPVGFPSLSGPDAEAEVSRAVAQLVARPGGTTLTARS